MHKIVNLDDDDELINTKKVSKVVCLTNVCNLDDDKKKVMEICLFSIDL